MLILMMIAMIFVMIALVAHAQEQAVLPRVHKCVSFANAYVCISLYIYIYIYIYAYDHIYIYI